MEIKTEKLIVEQRLERENPDLDECQLAELFDHLHDCIDEGMAF